MKCNRSAIKKGIILNIPINRIGSKKPQIYHNQNMVHEKFSPCKRVKEIVQIIPPPRRKRKIAPTIPQQPQLIVENVLNNTKRIKSNVSVDIQTKVILHQPINKNNLIKNKSELFRIAEYSIHHQDFCIKPPKRTKIKKSSNRLIETKDSMDIFNKKSTNENVFDDFDSYFQPITEVNHFLEKKKKSVKLNDNIILHSYSPPSSISLPYYDEICQEENYMDIDIPRMTSTIQVQEFSGKNSYSRCKMPVNNKQVEENSIENVYFSEFNIPKENQFDSKSNRKIVKTKKNLNNEVYKDFGGKLFHNEINRNRNKNLVLPLNKKLIADEINEKISIKNVTKNDLFDVAGVKKQKDINCYRNVENGDDIIDPSSVIKENKFADGVYSNENLRKITNEGILFLNLFDVRI